MLDKYQEEIVRSKEKNIVVVASPGSGKTTVIVNRAGYLISDLGVIASNIIIITFTRAAAENMKDRFRKLFPDLGVPFFGTFHSLFYGILKKHGNNIRIISSTEGCNVIESTLKKYMEEISNDRIKDVLSYISAYKTGFKQWHEFEECINLNVLTQCYNNYEEYKKVKGVLDFDDLQIGVQQLFKQNEKILKFYKECFKFIMVDEFQDCDALQLQFLKSICSGNSIFAVGDEDQCIYGFRGARPDYMVNFAENFEGAVKKYLVHNYRSKKNIVDMSGRLIENNKIRNDKEFSAINNCLGSITCERYFDERNQGDAIAEKICKEAQSSKLKYRDFAVLYRTNIESRALVDSFIKLKIPFNMQDKSYSFFNHFICKDLVSYLSLSQSLTDKESFLRVINKPFRYLSKINLEKLKHYKYKEDCIDILCSIPSIPIFQYKELRDLRRRIIYMDKLKISDLVEYILNNLDYKKYIDEYCHKNSVHREDLEDIINEFRESISNFNTIFEILEHIRAVERELQNDSKVEDDGVLLSTIHGVKGMEFKNVYIINCVEGSIPFSRGDKNNDIEEERRLFYVGITRTMENLHLGLAEHVRGKVKKESNFIKECGIEHIIEYTSEFEQGSLVYHTNFGEGTVLSLGKKEIEICFKAGMVRTFDLHVLTVHKLLKKMA